MKRSKQLNSWKSTRKPRPEIKSLADLRCLQRMMAGALFLPLTARDRLQPKWPDGRKMSDVVNEYIKPNDRLTAPERLEIYSRSYWFRILDCFHDDYPGLLSALGQRRFMKVAEAYLTKYPSTSFTLRNLGSRLEKFLIARPEFAGKKQNLALDLARFEWAQIVAFDAEAKTPLHLDELLGTDPSKLRLGLQPYITLLALEYPIDDFMLKVKKRDAMRGEASNAKTSGPAKSRSRRVIAPPRRKNTFVAIHRHDCSLYYKRLTPEAYAILVSLKKGLTVEHACERALRRTSLDTDWTSQIKSWFQNWSSLGWFCRLE